MKRRTFMSLVAGLMLAPSLVFAAESLEYEPGLIKQQLAEGKTVFVDYATDWCPTCRSQERTINILRDKNPEYDKNMVFVRVNWDVYGSHEVATERKIPRRSTLILLRGEKELGRILAETKLEKIKALMDKGLAE